MKINKKRIIIVVAILSIILIILLMTGTQKSYDEREITLELCQNLIDMPKKDRTAKIVDIVKVENQIIVGYTANKIEDNGHISIYSYGAIIFNLNDNGKYIISFNGSLKTHELNELTFYNYNIVKGYMLVINHDPTIKFLEISTNVNSKIYEFKEVPDMVMVPYSGEQERAKFLDENMNVKHGDL